MNYTAKVIETIDNGNGYWNYQKIGIFLDDNQIGEYIRNYSSFYNTFFPFNQGDDWYALCSPTYTGTSVMSLPDCKIICEEPKVSNGFCPTEYLVLTEKMLQSELIFINHKSDDYFRSHGWTEQEIEESYKEDLIPYTKYAGKLGFVAGCCWGDDSSWKLQALDLSDVKNGVIKRDDRFGYIELPSSVSLKDCISTSLIECEQIEIAVSKAFSLRENKWYDESEEWKKFNETFKTENIK